MEFAICSPKAPSYKPDATLAPAVLDDHPVPPCGPVQIPWAEVVPRLGVVLLPVARGGEESLVRLRKVHGPRHQEDERQSDQSKSGMIYSDDRSGIFNLYYIGKDRQGYLTNVPGGAFMGDIHENGKVVYALYEDGQYKLALLNNIEIVDYGQVGYTPYYFQRNKNLSPPLTASVQKESKK